MNPLVMATAARWLHRGGAKDVARIYHEIGAYVAELGAETPTEDMYRDAAEDAKTPPAAIKTIWQIESRQRALVDNVVIKRIEPHKWTMFGGDKRDLPRPLNPEDQAARHANFETLRAIDPKRAVLCSSFGGSQIMGFNAELCGFRDEEAYYIAMQAGARAQLRGMARFIAHPKNAVLQRAMQKGDARLVAFHWNGPRYRDNDYDKKYAAGIRRFS